MDKYIFSLDIEIRDYEIDSEGIVNNANYLHYLEYTRHKFCASEGMTFAQMQAEGLMPVVSRIEIDYKSPLRSDDVMVSRLWLERKGIRFVFHQDAFNKASGALVVSAVVTCVFLHGGRPSRADAIVSAFAKYLND